MKIIIIVLIVSMFLLSGCPYEEILDDTFGWLPGYDPDNDGGRSSNQPASAPTQSTTQPSTDDQNDDPLAQNQMDNMLQLPEPFCEPHGYFDGMQCVCDSGYKRSKDGLDCVRGGNCIYDKDCISKIPDLGCQFDGYRRKVARCNIRNYECEADYIDCRDYGNNYVCRSNQCLPMIMK